MGASGNPEAKIDLIAQAWSVLSHAAPRALQRQAMDSVEAHLVDPVAGLIKLLDPPLAHAVPSAGYIQAYPPGVRENGGQYCHAGVWALMAQAELAQHSPAANTTDDPVTPECTGDTVYRYFTYLSPAHRASHPTRGPVYGLEPYVMAGDIYSQPPYVGRGGWSWYTGSSAWMHRAAMASMFGMRQHDQTLMFYPCLPTHWPQAELTLVRGSRSLRLLVMRATPAQALSATTQWSASLLQPGQALHWPTLPDASCWVMTLA